VRRILVFLFVLSSLAGAVRARAGEKDLQVRIDAAIDRGVAHLLDLYHDGEGRDPRLQPGSPLTLLDRPGMRALTVYALLKSGVQPRHPVVERLVARLAFERFDQTYDVACMLLALEALDPVEHRAWIEELTAFLIAHRETSGGFGYPGGGDLSNTQFAALGLRAAAAAGVAIPAEVWSDLARAVLRHQGQDGGFAYRAGTGASTDSMTAAGVGVLAICEMGLVLSGGLDADTAQRVRRARTRGLAWLGNRLGKPPTAWSHYFLYALERAGALCSVETMGGHDWYREGARQLVDDQAGDGTWHGNYERAPTLFALLFLARATRVGPATGSRWSPVTGPRPRVFTHTPGTVTEGGMRLEAEGTRPLRMQVTRIVCPANATWEWPGERARGPRVALVEYRIDGAPVAVVLGDASQPAGDRRFECEQRVLAPGAHRLEARVHVRPPPARNGEGPREEKDGDAAVADVAVATNAVDVEVADDVPAAMAERPFEPRLDLLQQAKVTASASSVVSNVPAWEWGFAARQAVDGNPRSPWISAADDARPLLQLKLASPQRANRVRIAPARLAPRSPEFLTLPESITVAIDGGEARSITVGPEPRAWYEIVLAEPVTVRALEIRLVGRQFAGAGVGIGEVVLELVPE